MLPEILLDCEGDGTLWTPVPAPRLYCGHLHRIILLALEHLVNLLADDVLYSVPLILRHEAARQKVAVTALDLVDISHMVIKIGKASIPTVHWDLAHETDQRSGRHFEGI